MNLTPEMLALRQAVEDGDDFCLSVLIDLLDDQKDRLADGLRMALDLKSPPQPGVGENSDLVGWEKCDLPPLVYGQLSGGFIISRDSVYWRSRWYAWLALAEACVSSGYIPPDSP